MVRVAAWWRGNLTIKFKVLTGLKIYLGNLPLGAEKCMTLELISSHLGDEGEDMVISGVSHAVGYTEIKPRHGINAVSIYL